MLYTVTTFCEHLLVLAAGALQVLLFAWLFLRWERRSAGTSEGDNPAKKEFTHPEIGGVKVARGYVGRYTLVHVLVYIIVGVLFYQVSGYEEALDTMEAFELWRHLDDMVMPVVILFGQIIRGGILALFLYPFCRIYMSKQHGWMFLLALLFGLEVLASIITVPETAALFMQGLQDMKVGVPEIAIQTLLFAWLFFIWERKKLNRQEKVAT